MTNRTTRSLNEVRGDSDEAWEDLTNIVVMSKTDSSTLKQIDSLEK